MKKILFVALSMGAVAGTASASTRDLQRLAAQFGVDGSTCGLEKSTIPELCYFRQRDLAALVQSTSDDLGDDAHSATPRRRCNHGRAQQHVRILIQRRRRRQPNRGNGPRGNDNI